MKSNCTQQIAFIMSPIGQNRIGSKITNEITYETYNFTKIFFLQDSEDLNRRPEVVSARLPHLTPCRMDSPKGADPPVIAHDRQAGDA